MWSVSCRLLQCSISARSHSPTWDSAFLFVWVIFWVFRRVITLSPPLTVRGFGLCAAAVPQPSGFWSGIIWPWDYCERSSGCGQKWLRAGLTRLMLLNCTESQPMPAFLLGAAVWITLDFAAALAHLLIRRIWWNDDLSGCSGRAPI